jgi:hypothetical protein
LSHKAGAIKAIPVYQGVRSRERLARLNKCCQARPLVLVVNKEVWSSWSQADRAVVKQAAADAGKEEIGIACKPL